MISDLNDLLGLSVRYLHVDRERPYYIAGATAPLLQAHQECILSDNFSMCQGRSAVLVQPIIASGRPWYGELQSMVTDVTLVGVYICLKRRHADKADEVLLEWTSDPGYII